MNKIILTSHAAFDLLKNILQSLAGRGLYLLQRSPQRPDHRPQWQQLELPFSRTPVKRWNR